MPDIYLGEAIATAAQNVQQYNNERPLREARIRQAEAQATQAEQQVQQFETQAPLRASQQENEMARLRADTYATNAQLARSSSFEAFRSYQVDSDPRHLNNWLADSKNNPVAANTTAGMVRMDKLTRTPETERMLRSQGITDIEGFFSDPKLTSSMVLGTKQDGSQALIDMNRMYAVTGYAQHATDEARKEMLADASVVTRMRAGMNTTDIRADDAVVGELAKTLDISREEAARLLREKPAATAGRGSSAVERIAEQLRADNPDMSYRDSLTQAVELSRAPTRQTDQATFVSNYLNENPEASDEEALAAYREAGRDARTSKQKDLEFAEEAKVELDERFGGNFLDADISKLSSADTAEMAKYINRIERAGGLELSSEDKKNARAIRKLMGVSRTAGENLTSAETGPIDSVLRTFKSYVSDNVEGKDATVAYETFRAIARNALFGSQVSGADYTAFNKAFATLGQQTGPVLMSLKTQLETLRDDMQAMADLNDPYVAKARFGVNQDQLDDTINAIDDRLDIIRAVTEGRPVPNIVLPTNQEAASGVDVKVAPPGEPTPPAERPSLESIFGVANEG